MVSFGLKGVHVLFTKLIGSSTALLSRNITRLMKKCEQFESNNLSNGTAGSVAYPVI